MTTHLHASTHPADIAKRQKLGIPLTRKQERAVRGRSNNPPSPGICSYKRNNTVGYDVVPGLTQWHLVPKGK